MEPSIHSKNILKEGKKESILMRENRFYFSLLSFLLILSPLALNAVSYNFTGSGNWSNDLNWAGGTAPGPIIFSSDDITIAGDCLLDVDISSSAPITINSGESFTIPDGSTLTMTGDYTNNGATTIEENGEFVIGIAGEISFLSGTFNLDGLLTNSGILQINTSRNLVISNTGDLVFEDGATSDILGTVTNGGNIIINGGSFSINNTINNNSLITIGFNGFLTIASGGQLNNNNAATIDNAGGIVLTTSGSSITNLGSGSLSSSGTISGVGSINGPNITNENLGNISPGLSPGCLTLGSLTTSGTVTIEVDGLTACSEHDQIQSSNNLNLGGDLDVTINYTPDAGDQIIIIDAGSITGTFSSDNLDPDWSIAYNSPNPGEVSLNFMVLPVELSSFTVEEAPRNRGLLSWTTETEMDNKGFEVEHSMDGLNWKTLGFVEGKGRSVQTQRYEFQDRNPEDGTNYYRLKQVDFDGKTDYSPIRSLDFGNIRTNDMKVFPNPVNGREFTINLPEFEKETGVLRVFDMKGNLQLRKEFSGIATNIKTENMNPGMYLIEVKIGGEKFSDKIIVK
ncbi:MAG: T9SS type A sorting domain-containing protein [Saprospiraceae bacterium]